MKKEVNTMTMLGSLLGVVPGLIIGTIILFSSENPPDFQPSVYDFNDIWLVVIMATGVITATWTAYIKRRENLGFFVPLLFSLIGGVIWPGVLWFVYVIGLIILLVLWLLWQNILMIIIAGSIALIIWMIAQCRKGRVS